MDGEEALVLALNKSKAYAEGIALNGVPVKYPQVDPVSKHWKIFDPVANSYIDTGIIAEGKDAPIPTIGANGSWFVGANDTGIRAAGKDGRSAYQIAVANGFVGTETQWLTTLPGKKGDAGEGVPEGGNAGQILKKISNVDFDTEWANMPEAPTGGGIEEAPKNGKTHGRKDGAWAEIEEGGAIQTHNADTGAHADIRNILNNLTGPPEWDDENYKMTFTAISGQTLVIDLPLEALAKDLDYDPATKEIILLKKDGTEIRISVSDLVDEYTGLSNAHIQLTITNNEIEAVLLDGSIGEAKLSTALVEKINGKADKVQGAVEGNLTALDEHGNLADSGKSAADFATAGQGQLADNSAQMDSEGKIPAAIIPVAEENAIGGVMPGNGMSVDEQGRINWDGQIPQVSYWHSSENFSGGVIGGSCSVPLVSLTKITGPALAPNSSDRVYSADGFCFIIQSIVPGLEAGTESVEGFIIQVPPPSDAYQLPTTGIPRNDLSPAVQEILSQAETALQEETDPVYQSEKPGLALKADLSGHDTDSASHPGIRGLISGEASDRGTAIQSHNEDTDSHSDIRDVLNDLTGLPVWNNSTSVITFTTKNGQSLVVDLMLESLAKDMDYDPATKEIILTKQDDSEIRISVADLIDEYTGLSSAHIQVTIDDNEIRAALLDGSIGEEKLSSALLNKINGKADKVLGATNGNLAALNAVGNPVDSGKKTADFQAALSSGQLANIADVPNKLGKLELAADSAKLGGIPADRYMTIPYVPEPPTVPPLTGFTKIFDIVQTKPKGVYNLQPLSTYTDRPADAGNAAHTAVLTVHNQFTAALVENNTEPENRWEIVINQGNLQMTYLKRKLGAGWQWSTNYELNPAHALSVGECRFGWNDALCIYALDIYNLSIKPTAPCWYSGLDANNKRYYYLKTGGGLFVEFQDEGWNLQTPSTISNGWFVAALGSSTKGFRPVDLSCSMGFNGGIGSLIGKKVVSFQIRGDGVSSAGAGAVGAFDWGKFLGWDNYPTPQDCEVALGSSTNAYLYINAMAAL